MGSLGSVLGSVGGAVGGLEAASSIQNQLPISAQEDLTGLNFAGNSPAMQNYIGTGSASQTGAAGVNNTVNQLLTGNQQTPAFQNYLNSTGYNFMLGQGLGAINSSAASKGLLQSGGTAKDLMTYGTNLASTTFNNYLSNLNSNASSMQANAAPGMAGLQSTITAGTQGGIAAGNQGVQGVTSAATANTNGLTNAGNALGNGLTALISDVRAKHRIHKVGDTPSGIGLFSFHYIGCAQKFIGVLAQEIARKVPQACVRGADGYLRVYYDRLGLQMQRA